MTVAKFTYLTAALLTAFSFNSSAQKSLPIIVNADKVTAKVQPTMWGVFFEDINMGADGGIYAELVKNRSFEFYSPLMGWSVKGKKITEGDVLILNRQQNPITNPNPRFLRANVKNADNRADFSLTNEGFRGMGIKKGLSYNFSVMYRQEKPGVKMHLELLDEKGNVIGSTVFQPAQSGTEWHKQGLSFTANATAPKGKFAIWMEGTGVIDLDMISLFPGDTWKQRPGGLRADMVQLLADMKPGFIRFPGGCIVEGRDLATRYPWKKTIGPVENRELNINRWNTEFKHRLTGDYFQTYGLGFFEYFQLAEDIGAEALPILNCGMACQFNTAELVPLDQLGPYVQDALDLVQFANGDVSTPWGKKRAEMGHPAPFNLKMMGVGNENWGPQYLERLKIFTDSLKAKYPEIKLVNSSGTDPNGDRFDFLNNNLRKNKADIIDEHYYRSPEWFLSNATRYDSYDRNGSKVFAGEYAAQSNGIASEKNQNNWQCALAEAAFMTGLERNAQVINMASYAPLFAHADAWQWTPDMIWVDNLNVYGTPNYYVQKLYSLYKGTDVVDIKAGKKIVAGQDSLYASAVVDSKHNELIIKIVNASGKAQTRNLQVQSRHKMPATGILTSISTPNLKAINSFDNAVNVSPKDERIVVKGKMLAVAIKPYSFNVLRLPLIK